MLDGLEAIAWNTKQHAFGEATNVPSLLRAVEDGGSGADHAISELFNTVWHQGTVYDATAEAVPFVAELATSARLTLTQRKLLLALLFAIGRGKGYWQVHTEHGRLGSTPDDLPSVLAAEERTVFSCRAAVASESSKLLDQITEFPTPLWLSVAVLLLVARRSAPVTRVSRTRPGLQAFGEAGFNAILELSETGQLRADAVEQVAALDDDLHDFLHHGLEEPVGDVLLEDYFVDVLVERLCDSEGRGSTAAH